MSKWQDKSDFEINKAAFLLAAKEGLVNFEDLMEKQNPNRNGVMYGDGANWYEWDGCNNPADAWPIILDNGICINSMPGGDFTLWYAHDKFHTNVDSAIYDENPLRAAMIVYLEMNGINSK